MVGMNVGNGTQAEKNMESTKKMPCSTQHRNWVESLIGLPFTATGTKPRQGFNCWTFVVWVQRTYFGVDLRLSSERGSLRTRARAAKSSVQSTLQRLPVDAAWRAGDVLLLQQGSVPIHIGVWIEEDGGGLLHCEDPVGVICEPSATFRRRWQIEGVYRYAGALRYV